MSLTDELLADLDQLRDDDAEVMAVDAPPPASDMMQLVSSERLGSVVDRVRHYRAQLPCIKEPVELDPEYLLIVEANALVADIKQELELVHRLVRELYHKRFPELESLVPLPMDYIRSVQVLGNRIEGAALLSFLSPATVMIVSVTASTTQGSRLQPSELKGVEDACAVALDLAEREAEICEYVGSRMVFIAPNLSALLGSPTAAKLIGAAGGLSSLNKMPACNILVLGSHKKFSSSSAGAGFSLSTQEHHMGFSAVGYIAECDIVQSCPTPELRTKIGRLVACKCALAARVDHFRSFKNGEQGKKFRTDVIRRIEKLTEPPPIKQVKPLPPPIEQAGQRRGGRRARKMKERLGITEVRKQANRMTFGEIEQDAYQEDLGLSLGQMGKSDSGAKSAGRIRAAQIDAKTKTRISQKLHKTIQKDRKAFGSAIASSSHGSQTALRRSVAGTASSVVFTPFQGLEIISAGAMSEMGSLGENGTATATGSQSSVNKYFSSIAGFSKVKEKK